LLAPAMVRVPRRAFRCAGRGVRRLVQRVPQRHGPLRQPPHRNQPGRPTGLQFPPVPLFPPVTTGPPPPSAALLLGRRTPVGKRPAAPEELRQSLRSLLPNRAP